MARPTRPSDTSLINKCIGTETLLPEKNFCNKVRIEHRADVDRWLRHTLHPADYTTLHMHFIDNSPSDLTKLYKAVNAPKTLQEHVSFEATKMARDIKSLCLFTDGVLVSWSGEKGTHLHHMFEELCKDKDINAFKPGSVVVTLAYVQEALVTSGSGSKWAGSVRSQDYSYYKVEYSTLMTDSAGTANCRRTLQEARDIRLHSGCLGNCMQAEHGKTEATCNDA